MWEKIRVSVGGDPEGGWLVDIHDGETNAVYSPEAKNQNAAVEAALASHRKEFPKAPTESDYEPLPEETAAEPTAIETTDAVEAAPASDAVTDTAQTAAG